ncbi:PTS system, ascorbate-specific IIB component [Spiroplasma helicoides]|uniref:PTS system, ascorbate-specific IIB component n=1 Tax=Spiroplasma helicoides TaxID=216938 RepID=A0A1B3SLZ7_9MOLU|nr:hypothetical protein [Spiroplasma helicoides]AOG60966.1 PTS system, ascorbate-specific IIB component [Spiroplasma helicoides]
MKFVAVCGQGLGSSLIIEMSIRDILISMGRDDIEVEHTNLNSFNNGDPSIDAVICGIDLADSIDFENKIVLNNLLDKEEIEEKLSEFFKENAM